MLVEKSDQLDPLETRPPRKQRCDAWLALFHESRRCRGRAVVRVQAWSSESPRDRCARHGASDLTGNLEVAFWPTERDAE